MVALCFNTPITGMRTPSLAATGNGDLRLSEKPSVSAVHQRNSPWGFSFRHPIPSLWPMGKNRHEQAIAVDDAVSIDKREDLEGREEEKRNETWVLKILSVNSIWAGERKTGYPDEEKGVDLEEDDRNCGSGNGECEGCAVDDDDEKIVFDRESFSKLLGKVSFEEVVLYAKMAYLGNMAYSVATIKPEKLLKYHGLRVVTSSLEKKEQVLKVEKEKQPSEEIQVEAKKAAKSRDDSKKRISASIAYQIAASAASYLHSHTKSILRRKLMNSMPNGDLTGGSNEMKDTIDMLNHDMASLMATDSVTAVVAAKEEVKQAVADDLNSTKSSSCDWFICDDDRTSTRFFVIQGSESLASWQANLLFEPIKFEGLDVLVHRGIYEAGKGIYEQMLPEIEAHLAAHGKNAKFRFTGHSLGGSLSMVINLMLLIRGVLPHSSLLPVITFGSPSIMCGGDHLLRILGLPRNHIQSIMLHRDIVPRAFSCHYPTHVAEFLKAVNSNFRNLPCLNNQKFLYAPIGQMLILQPDNRVSPNHELLPSGRGLYLLSCEDLNSDKAEKMIRAAQSVFLNSPHPLEILSDRSAYGSGGTIQRDHDIKSYLKTVRNELKRRRKARRGRRGKIWWRIVSIGGGIIVGSRSAIMAASRRGLNLSIIIQSSGESLMKFSRFVVSQRLHFLLLVFFHARLLLVGMYQLIQIL